jgi:hypothetical protein
MTLGDGNGCDENASVAPSLVRTTIKGGAAIIITIASMPNTIDSVGGILIGTSKRTQSSRVAEFSDSN